MKKVGTKLVGGRKTNKEKEYEYESKYAGSSVDSGEYLNTKILNRMGWDKAMKQTDLKISQRAGLYVRSLSAKSVEKHLGDYGLCGINLTFLFLTSLRIISTVKHVQNITF